MTPEPWLSQHPPQLIRPSEEILISAGSQEQGRVIVVMDLIGTSLWVVLCWERVSE